MTSLSAVEADEYARLADRVEEYSRTWFNDPIEPQLTYIRSDPAVLMRLRERGLEQPVSTQDAYFRDEQWLAAREDVEHRAALGTLEPIVSGEVPPNCYFLIGKPGSGKSSVLRDVARRHFEATGVSVPVEPLFVDADVLRTQLPEYRNGLGSGIVHGEVSHLTYEEDHECVVPGPRRNAMSLEPGSTVAMFDIVGDRSYLPKSVKSMKDRGWSVFVLCTDCPDSIALDRAARRALSEGRYVAPGVIQDAGSRSSGALSWAKKHVDGWALIDTSGDHPHDAFISAGDGTFGEVDQRPLAES